MKKFLQKHNNSRKINNLIENISTYHSEVAELHVFETFTQIERFNLNLNFPFIANMLTGKKMIHPKEGTSFEFLPGESMIVPANKTLQIDFPEASKSNPTQCTVLSIDQSLINSTIDYFNEKVAIENENNRWSLNEVNPTHLVNNQDLNSAISRLINNFTKENVTKDMIIELLIKELIIRLLQTNARHILMFSTFDNKDSRLGEVIRYIKQNLTEKNINVEVLANLACMSSSHFYKQFKNTLGISPVEYVNSERIKFAKKILAAKKNLNITDVAYLSGFNSAAYFIRQFKKHEMISPGAYVKALR